MKETEEQPPDKENRYTTKHVEGNEIYYEKFVQQVGVYLHDHKEIQGVFFLI